MTNPDREEWQILDLFGNWVPAPSKAAAIGCVQDGTATALRRLASSDGGVKVRELEWIERTGVTGTFDARTSIGHYIATITDDGRGMWFIVGLTTSNYTIGDIDVVRAAAQADYEARIKAALVEVPPSDPSSTRSEVTVDELVEWCKRNQFFPSWDKARALLDQFEIRRK